MKLGKSQRDRDTRRVASIAVYRGEKLLWLRRADNGKLTLPGGHLEPGEEPLAGAGRELREETGLGGDLECIGSASVPGKDMRVYSFVANIPDGEPDASQDPDAEAQEFLWLTPEEAAADKLHVPEDKNVTIRLLAGLDVEETPEELSKATKFWRARDGLKLPHHTSPERPAWDRGYHQALVRVFGNGEETRLKPLRVPTDPATSGHYVQPGGIGGGDRYRVPFYTRMLAGGDTLPPIVVRRNGQGFTVVDGNSRLAAARARGLTHLDALEIVDPVKKSEPLRKHDPEQKELFPGSVSQGPRPKIPGAEHVRDALDRMHAEIDHRYNHLHQTAEAQGLGPGDYDTGDDGLIPHDCARCQAFPVPQYNIGHCTSTAHEIARPLRGKIMGYPEAKDIGASLGEGLGEGGHDFAVIGNRYLADWWANSYHDKPDLWDLQNPEHMQQVRKLYGDPSRWETLHDYGQEPVQKSLAGAAAGVLMTLAQGHAMPKPTVHDQAQQAGFRPWTAAGLHPDLVPIAHLESSFGQNVKHVPSSRGDYHTAVGALGLKPVTAHEEYLRNQRLQALYPKLKDPADFTKQLKQDPGFYNLVAGAHWLRLKSLHGTPERTAYAWRWGSASARAAAEDQVQNDAYVQHYRNLAASAGVRKSQDLQKMAIKDLRPGKPVGERQNGYQVYDHSHLLSPVLRRKYKLEVVEDPEAWQLKARVRLHDPDWGRTSLGSVSGFLEDGNINVDMAHLNEAHQGKGLGQKMYEALYTHAFHRHGVRLVQGDIHSSMAHHAHEALARKHGLKLKTQWSRPQEQPRPYDEAYGPYEYTLKSEPDGISHLQGVDDPVERRLALKAQTVTPYHLRQALHDEDPSVREAAALHPGLTPELIQEVLAGDDDWLREQVLTRPDLRDHHLDLALADPKLRAQALQHPGLTLEQRNRVLQDPGLDEAHRDIAMQGLVKNIGFITYPQLGVGRAPTGVMTVAREKMNSYRRVQSQGNFKPGPDTETDSGAINYNAWTRSQTPPESRHLSGVVGVGSDPKLPLNEATRRRVFGDLPGARTDMIRAVVQQRGPTRRIQHGKAVAADEAHEIQHGVYARLKQIHGQAAVRTVLNHAHASLTEAQRQHLNKLFGGTGAEYGPEKHAEEQITFLHNYLQDPEHRRIVNINLGQSGNTEAQRQDLALARQTWQALQRHGQALRPQDLGLTYKKDEVVLAEYASRLQKSREPVSSGVEDHLGHDSMFQALIEAAEFLTQKALDPALLRARLLDSDGDPREAVCQAAGLDSPEQRQALDAVLHLKDMKKAESAPKQIQALTGSAQEFADSIRWAAQHQKLEPVHLGGKHSRGAEIASDSDGNLLLIKPGSGKQSPAAGAGQEPASQSRREACFSEVARSWGLAAYVPRAELVDIDGREVAVLEMLGLDWTGLHRARSQDPGLPRKALRPYLDRGILHRWAVLDFVAGNPDRHGQNIMVGPADAGNKIALIDHGSAFAGPGFDPGADKNSFVPYYLRVWGPDQGWSRMSAEEQLKTLPTLPDAADTEFRAWVLDLSPDQLSQVLHRYGINPEPSLKRLQDLQQALRQQPGPASGIINWFWVA